MNKNKTKTKEYIFIVYLTIITITAILFELMIFGIIPIEKMKSLDTSERLFLGIIALICIIALIYAIKRNVYYDVNENNK